MSEQDDSERFFDENLEAELQDMLAASDAGRRLDVYEPERRIRELLWVLDPATDKYVQRELLEVDWTEALQQVVNLYQACQFARATADGLRKRQENGGSGG